ncbi:MAG: branched-chain amino acid aminotransferase [Bacteroidales bacterium]|nr:branched-chain amino acid aminotransferase [Bacteroidales bacterium]
MQNIDWGELPFAYMKTDYNVRCYFQNGKWGELEISSSEYLNLHMAATSLHYGQEAFEGLKAFKGKDGKIRIFRLDENAKRLESSASGLLMAKVPGDLFEKAVIKAVELNKDFVPPFGLGASLYIRPLLIGSGAEVGVKAAKEYLFLVFVTPVGPYFKEGFKPVDLFICRDFDRAAPLGTGNIKAGGNYAASLIPTNLAHKDGYAAILYLDAKEKKYIDECGPANFFGIKGNKYITPDSKSILPSITNKSLMKLAEDMGMEVEVRKVHVEELAEFDEVGACGTAAVITPVKKIVDPGTNKIYEYCQDGNPGKISTKLYNRLTAIQFGEMEDVHDWIRIIN